MARSARRTRPGAAARVVTPLRGAVAVGVLILGSLAAAPAARAASGDVVCQPDATRWGVVERTVVHGDLVVLDGTGCDVRRVSVDGDVRVGRSSYLIAYRSTTKGDVLVSPDGSASLDHSTLHCGAVLDDGDGLGLIHSSVRHSVRGDTRSVRIENTRLDGNVTLSTRDFLYISDTSVGGTVRVSGGDVGIGASSVGHDFAVVGADRFDLCGSTVGRNARVVGVRTEARVGVLREGAQVCGTPTAAATDARAVKIGGTLSLTGNPGPVLATGTAVDGDLVCQGNATRPDTAGADVAGQRLGQCATP